MKFLVVKDQIYMPHVKLTRGNDTENPIWIPIENIEIAGNLNEDPEKVTILSEQSTIALINELANSNFNVKYYQTILGEVTYPSQELINELYTTSGLFVKDIATDKDIILSVNGDGTDIIIDGVTYTQIKPDDLDGLLFKVESTGVIQIVGVMNGEWFVDEFKNKYTVLFSDLQKQIDNINTRFDVLPNFAAFQISHLQNGISVVTSFNDWYNSVDWNEDTNLHLSKVILTKGILDDKLQVELSKYLTTAAFDNVKNTYVSNTNYQAGLSQQATTNAALSQALTTKLDTTTFTASQTQQGIVDVQQNQQLAAITTRVDTVEATTATNTTNIAANTSGVAGAITRITTLENASSGNVSGYLTAELKYVSDIGTPRLAGGTQFLSVYDLAGLQQPNTGTTIPPFSFADEGIFTIKIRFNYTANPALKRNYIFTLNTQDAEPTILTINDRSGGNVNTGVNLLGQIAADGKVTFKIENIDGTTPAFSLIDLSSAVVTEVQQLVFVPKGQIPTRAEVDALTTKQNKLETDVAAWVTVNPATKVDATRPVLDNILPIGEVTGNLGNYSGTLITTQAVDKKIAAATPKLNSDNLTLDPQVEYTLTGTPTTPLKIQPLKHPVEKVKVQNSAGIVTADTMDGSSADNLLTTISMLTATYSQAAHKDLANVTLASLTNLVADASKAGLVLQVDANGKLVFGSLHLDGLGIPTRKDITATYATRKWNANDAGKRVYITFSYGSILLMKVGFISEGVDTSFSKGGAVVDLGISFTDSSRQERLYWSTEHVSNVGDMVLHTDSKIEIVEATYNINKFEIEE